MAYRTFLDAGIAVAAGSDFSPGPFDAYSERCRSAFRGDGDRDSELMPIAIPG